MSGAKKFYILTLGCQMNKNDSERVAGLLCSRGWREVSEPEGADLLIVNTCSVRQSAEDRVRGFVKNWQVLKEKKPGLVIAVTGCLPGRDKDAKLRATFPGVDLFFGINDLPMLPQWLGELSGGITEDYLSIAPKREDKYRAFITIQTGCDNYCTYCVVPYARGRERNRKVADIVAEARAVAADGAVEITLLGQVVNHYIASDRENFSPENTFAGRDDFAALLWELNQIDGINRIHFTAPDPQYFSAAQIEALSLPKQVNYLHLPVQSGDNEILRKMNRHYTREEYIDLVKKIRAARPDIALGTDIIVGFCGETEAQFENTLDLYRACDFDISFHAMYSERSGTAAAKALKDDVSRADKKRRWDALQEIMEKRTFEKNQKYLDREVEVLVESCNGGICSGNTREMKLAQFPGTLDLVGQVVRMRVSRPEMWVLMGERVK